MDTWYIGICTECANEQPGKYMERTKFEQPSCRYCGGVVKVMAIPDDDKLAAARKAAAIEAANAKRGIYSKPSEGDDDDTSGVYTV